MSDDRQNLLARREIVVAHMTVLERLEELVALCSTVAGDPHELRSAVCETFELSPVAADAVLALQVRRFTPYERRRIQDELNDIDLRLRRATGT
ncbi:hypothetical protein [Microbacterium telephonicum]|uniref:hypothetical protein n=1 Tax=Microbacterium telephonicum TaxID=1714841 RepID=UPI000EAB79DA|nr:hypothetical protein [Microbacterium telephonicum]